MNHLWNDLVYWKKGGIIGGVFALIPYSISLIFSEGGYIIFIIPVFLPILFTIGLATSFLQFLSLSPKDFAYFDILMNFINIILCIAIGAFIGWLIGRWKGNWNNKS